MELCPNKNNILPSSSVVTSTVEEYGPGAMVIAATEHV